MSHGTEPVGASHAELLRDVRALLAECPPEITSKIRLLMMPEGADLAPGEVLLPEARADGTVALRPSRAVDRAAPPPTITGLGKEVRIAGSVVNTIWREILKGGGPRSESREPLLVRGAFDSSWIAEVPLPIEDARPQTQTVSLINDNGFDRFTDSAMARDAYDQRRRTRVYEIIDERSDGWFALATRQLSRLAGCEVACTVYDSAAGDESLGEHVDMWYGAIVQTRGEKNWDIRATVTDAPHRISLRAGDLMLLPWEILHNVSTPVRSTHIVFAFLIHRPLSG